MEIFPKFFVYFTFPLHTILYTHLQDVHSEFGQDAALVIVKFLERVYRDVPQFAKMATQPEFVESLVATLFPPIGRATVNSPIFYLPCLFL